MIILEKINVKRLELVSYHEVNSDAVSNRQIFSENVKPTPTTADLPHASGIVSPGSRIKVNMRYV